MINKILLGTTLSILLFSSCMNQRFVVKSDYREIPGRIPDAEIQTHHLILGLIPLDSEINAAELCAKKIDKIEDKEEFFFDTPWNFIIGWVWYSRTVSVYCTK